MDLLLISAEKGGREVEIDRCTDCGALWFDAGELEKSVNLRARPNNALSDLHCPICRTRMQAASLPGGAFAHHCESCHGVLLDPLGIDVLGHSRLPLPPGSKPSRAGFICVRCQNRFPFALGNGTNLGLMCGGCVVNPQVEKLPEPSARSLALDRVTALDIISSLFFSSLD